MSLQDDFGYLLTVAQDSPEDTSFIETHLKEAKDAEAQGNYSVARDHMSKLVSGQGSLSSDDPVGNLNEAAQERVLEVYDAIVEKL